MENDNLSVPKRDVSPIPIRVTDEELAARSDVKKAFLIYSKLVFIIIDSKINKHLINKILN